MSGHFFVFEGGDGTGKTTQSKLFAEAINAIWTREPGGTAIGTQLRSLLLDKDSDVSPRTEAILMAADRSEHVDKLIRPALVSGQSVVCDRYIGSTIAYQGYGRGHDIPWLKKLSLWAAEDLMPDLTIFMTVPREVALERMSDKAPDKFESLDNTFHADVQRGYEEQAALDGWKTVDGSGTEHEVHERVMEAYSEFLRGRF